MPDEGVSGGYLVLLWVETRMRSPVERDTHAHAERESKCTRDSVMCCGEYCMSSISLLNDVQAASQPSRERERGSGSGAAAVSTSRLDQSWSSETEMQQYDKTSLAINLTVMGR